MVWCEQTHHDGTATQGYAVQGETALHLWLLHHADPDEDPVFLAKFDISDGFYHLFLEPDDALKLTVLML